MMKKIILLMSCMLLGMATQAQTSTRWGVTAGLNYNQIHFKQSDIIKVDRGLGPMVGVTGEMNVPGVGFAVDASLLYSMRSGKLHLGDKKIWSSLGYGNETCLIHYVDLPLNLKFKYHNLNGVENTIMPMVFAGPTFSFVAGKNLSGVNQYKSVSVLLHAGIGCELFNRVQVAASYSFSLGESLRTKLLDENVAKNRCWSLTATYFFK